MVVKRLVAALLAVALVVGALWLRSRLDSDDASSDDPSTTTSPPATALLCIPELEEACRVVAAAEGLSLTIEAAGTTVDRLAADDDDPDDVLWATFEPLAALVDDLRARAGRAPLFAEAGEPVGSSRLVLVGRTAQLDVLAAHCGGEVTWRCLGEVAGQPWTGIGGQAGWRDVKPAHEAVDTGGVGLLTFANAVVSWFGRTDIGTVDLADDAFQDWVRRLERSIPSFGGPAGTPFDQLLLLPSPNVVGTTEAEVNAKAGARRSELTVAYPAPMAQADAVVVSGGGASVPGGVATELRTALTGAGWDPPSEAPPGGLPEPPVLEALRQLWVGIVR